MKIDAFIPTYKRPSITNLCLNTLTNNTNVKLNSINIFDDSSNKEMMDSLYKLLNIDNNIIKINISFRNSNYGVGFSFEHIYKSIDMYEPDIAIISESDYIWRKGWLEDVISVYNINPHVVAIPGTSHPDMYDMTKVKGEYIKFMIDQWGEDIKSRDFMYSPFYLSKDNIKIKVQGVANSCGCLILFWNRWKKILQSLNYEGLYWNWMNKAFHKNENRSLASDAIMSGSISYIWEKWAIKNNIDITKNFAFLDICDYSIGQHMCGGQDSINGKIVPEGSTFILSPCWKNEYLEKNPRQITT